MTQQTIKSTDEIMAELDRWVRVNGNGQYVPENFKPNNELSLGPDYGIQQVRKEIYEFVKEIIDRKLTNNAMEIGLGYYGSTHFLWRLLFDRVITIEKSLDRCRNFAIHYDAFYKDSTLTNDERSGFIFGLSSDPSSVRKAYGAMRQKADLLFIDGDHSYQGVLCDWLLYHNIVRKGGLVAFHDCSSDILSQTEVPKLINKLEKGEMDGIMYQFRKIIYCKYVGIAFYEHIS